MRGYLDRNYLYESLEAGIFDMDDTSDIGTFHLPFKHVNAQPASETIKLPSKPDLAAHEDGQQPTLESNIIGTKSTSFPRV